MSDKVQCAAGDYLELFVINSQGTAMNITSADNYFAVALITAGPGPQGPQGTTGPAGPGGAAYSVQRKLGSVGGYVAVTPGAVLDGGKMTLSITPTIPVWWEVVGVAGLVMKMDAAYNYLCGQLHMVPADQDGVADVLQYISQHSQVQTYEGRNVQRLYRLAAGTTYTVQFILGNGDGGTWQIYNDPLRLYLEAKAWAQ